MLKKPKPAIQTKPKTQNKAKPSSRDAPDTNSSMQIYDDTTSTKDTGRAWFKSSVRAKAIDELEKGFNGNIPRMLSNFKDIRVDTRQLNATTYEVQEIQGPVQVPNSFAVADKAIARVSSIKYFEQTDGGSPNVFGIRGFTGDLDVQAFVVLTETKIMDNAASLAKVAQSTKQLMEQFQDDIYRISGGRARYTRVMCGIVGFASTKGSFQTRSGPEEYDILSECENNEQIVIERACRYAGLKWGWDVSYARQALMLLSYQCPCLEWAGLARTNCDPICNAFISGAKDSLAWIRNAKGDGPSSFSRGVILHELSHNLGLAHASEGNMEYGDTSTFMGNSASNAKDMNSLHMLALGWMQNVQLVSIDSLTPSGASVALQDNYHSCVVIVAPIMVISKNRSVCTGFLPCPVLCIAIRGEVGKQEAHVHSFGYDGILEHDDITRMYKRTFLLGKLTASAKELSVNTNSQGKSLLPPYIVLDESKGTSDEKGFLKDTIGALKLSSNKMQDFKIMIQIEGTYAGRGALKLRIRKGQ